MSSTARHVAQLKYFGLLGSMEHLVLLTWEERLDTAVAVNNVDFYKLLSKVDDE